MALPSPTTVETSPAPAIAEASPTVETWTQARSRLALLHRDDAPAPAIAEARRDLRAARLADYIQRTVDAAPPLTADQRDRLALLLQSGGSDAAA